MKILTCNPNGSAYSYILAGISKAFALAGNDVSCVKSNVVPCDFDLYIGCSGWRQQIPPKEKRRGKVGIHVNPYGDTKVGHYDGGPIIDESREAIKWVLNQQPDFVYGYCPKAFIDEYYGYWTTKHGIPVVAMPNAADITVYYPHKPDDKFKCEIGWVGGRWLYKAKMLDKYLTPLVTTKKCLIYGWGDTWKNKKVISDNDVPALFASAKICPSVSESHSVHHPVDIPERVFKIPASGGFTIHTPSPAIYNLFGDVIPMATDPHHWKQLVDYYLLHETARVELALKQRQLIYQKHTYFDRCKGIAEILNDPAMIENLEKAKSKIIQSF